MNTPFLILGQLKELDLGMSDKPDYFNVKATVAFARKESCLYTACPNQDCNKKVTEVGTSEYHCEKCNQTFPNFKYRMILTVSCGLCGVGICTAGLVGPCFQQFTLEIRTLKSVTH